MNAVQYLTEMNAALLEALTIVSNNLTRDDGIDPEAWWLELTADQVAMIRQVVERAKEPVAIPSSQPFPPMDSLPVAQPS